MLNIYEIIKKSLRMYKEELVAKIRIEEKKNKMDSYIYE